MKILTLFQEPVTSYISKIRVDLNLSVIGKSHEFHLYITFILYILHCKYKVSLKIYSF